MNLILRLALVLFIVIGIACSADSRVTIAEVRRKPGCYLPESTYAISRATLSPDGTRVPLTNGLVLRSLSQDTAHIAAIVPDSLPVGRPITRRYHVHSGLLLGIMFDGPVLLLATDSTRGSR